MADQISRDAVMLASIEREVIVLRAVKELIDSIVNFEVLLLGDTDPTEIRFKTMTHAQFFNIMVVDLLSKTDKGGLIEPEPYLGALKGITASPHFNIGGSVALLRDTTNGFVSWLETSLTIDKVWLPSISIEIDLELTRFDLVKIAGNICRHNILRAVGIAGDVRKILAKNGIIITVDQSLLVLSDLFKWLHTHVFNYHSSTIAEFLNNIRWGIYDYLQPEFSRSIVWEGGGQPKYRYTIPAGINAEFAKVFYWDLMNEVRRPPYMRKFRVIECLKGRY